MATAKSLAEQIIITEEEIKQKENRLKELKQKYKSQGSKERTHRLIERGAILESFIDGATSLTNEQLKSFLEKTIQTDFARKTLTQFREQNNNKSEVEQSGQQNGNDEATGGNGEGAQTTLDMG